MTSHLFESRYSEIYSLPLSYFVTDGDRLRSDDGLSFQGHGAQLEQQLEETRGENSRLRQHIGVSAFTEPFSLPFPSLSSPPFPLTSPPLPGADVALAFKVPSLAPSLLGSYKIIDTFL